MDEIRQNGPPANQVPDSSVVFVRAQLFLSSYSPLFVILAIRFHGSTLKYSCAVLAVLGFAYLVLVVYAAPRRAAQRSYRVVSADDASGEVSGYLATYLLPFVTVPSPSVADLSGYIILAVIVAVIFVRSELARINPALYLLGWRVASVNTGVADRYLVCRRLPRPGTEIRASSVAGLLIRKEPGRYG